MSEWGTVALGEILTLKYGRALKNGDRKGGPVPVVGSSGIVGWHDASIVDKSTLVIGRKGSIGSLTLIEGASWPIDTAYYADFDPEIVDLRWLAHQLAGFDLKLLNKAAAVPGLNRDDVYRLHTVLPPLTEQRRIASILDEVDAIRTKRRAQLAHLDELPRSLLHEALGETKWAQEKIGTLGKVTTGKTPPTGKDGMFGGSIPFVTPGDLGSGSTSVRTVTPEGAQLSRTVSPGATLVCCIGATIGKTGRTAERSAFNQQINAIEWGDNIDDTFGYFLMKSMSPTIANAGASTTLPLLPKGRFVELEIPTPPLRVQHAFAEKVTAIRAERDRVARALEADDELFAALQHRAFRGEL